MTPKAILGLVLGIGLAGSLGGALWGQKAPSAAPTPQAAPPAQSKQEVAPETPEPPEPPEAPEAPEPPDPPEAPEVFVLNDGQAHLGVTLSDVSAEKAHELKLPAVGGAMVNSVQKDSAAAKAGVEAGDAITEFDGIRVRSSAELRRLIRETPAGRTVEINVVRDGKTRVLSAKMEAAGSRHFSYNYNYNMPEIHIPAIKVPDLHVPPMNFSFFGDHGALLGVSADELTPQLAQYFGVKQGKGVLIAEVTKGGAADKAGLKAGDVIVRVDGTPVGCLEELRSALNDNFTDDTRKLSLTIVRDHHEQTLKAELTHLRMWENHDSSVLGTSRERALASANQERAGVQAEVAREQQALQGEWQRQLQEQMRSLKDQLKQVQKSYVVPSQNGEI